MPDNLNPDHLGEFAKLYYMLPPNAPVTLATADAYPSVAEDTAILSNANWLELCVISVSPSSNINNYEVQDRCVGDIVGNTPGRESFTLDVTMNELRLGDGTFPLYDWMKAMDTRQIISLMALTSKREDGDAWGFVGNFVRIDETEEQPETGLMTITYTFGPAARAAAPLKRRIFGANYSTRDTSAGQAAQPDPLDKSSTISPANRAGTLAQLKADGTNGDGNYAGAAFSVGEYVTLSDGKAHYDGSNWQSGAAT